MSARVLGPRYKNSGQRHPTCLKCPKIGKCLKNATFINLLKNHAFALKHGGNECGACTWQLRARV